MDRITDRSPSGRDLVESLKQPAAYAHEVRDVGFLQTHISWLFFAGDRVYKVKKPVDMGFLDFTTLERRQHFCEEEVRLNRRMSPEVYLGVVPITCDADGRLHVSGEGETVEWAVEMTRLPDRGMFLHLLEQDEIDNQQIHDLVSLLAEFHGRCATGPGVDEFGSADSVAVNVNENFEQLEGFVGSRGTSEAAAVQVLSRTQLDFLSSQARRYLDEHAELFQRRIAEHRIREGHGDLHAGNLCITDSGVVAYDCIEFSQRFRCGDVASDLAFLAMDLDYRGFPAFSSYLVKRYALRTGDDDLIGLQPFYKGYRAVVRGKVAAMTACGAEASEPLREEKRLEAMRYLQLAVGYELRPTLILMSGLPACGKSWLAEQLARPLRAVLLSSDVRRKTLQRMAPTTHVHENYNAGLYSPESKAAVYESLLLGALDALRAGHSVIVDATFAKRDQRAHFVDAATRLGQPYVVVHVSASEEVTRQRLEARKKDPKRKSDADLAIYLKARESFEPLDEVPEGHLVRDASGEATAETRCSELIDCLIALTAR